MGFRFTKHFCLIFLFTIFFTNSYYGQVVIKEKVEIEPEIKTLSKNLDSPYNVTYEFKFIEEPRVFLQIAEFIKITSDSLHLPQSSNVSKSYDIGNHTITLKLYNVLPGGFRISISPKLDEHDLSLLRYRYKVDGADYSEYSKVVDQYSFLNVTSFHLQNPIKEELILEIFDPDLDFAEYNYSIITSGTNSNFATNLWDSQNEIVTLSIFDQDTVFNFRNILSGEFVGKQISGYIREIDGKFDIVPVVELNDSVKLGVNAYVNGRFMNFDTTTVYPNKLFIKSESCTFNPGQECKLTFFCARKGWENN
ncbi:MAG: hypothetical protein JEY94_16570 [Melioribacteraceae bacterium]|nr:hypothetical protein [Melioribacteraceae bacterium]